MITKIYALNQVIISEQEFDKTLNKIQDGERIVGLATCYVKSPSCVVMCEGCVAEGPYKTILDNLVVYLPHKEEPFKFLCDKEDAGRTLAFEEAVGQLTKAMG